MAGPRPGHPRLVCRPTGVDASEQDCRDLIRRSGVDSQPIGSTVFGKLTSRMRGHELGASPNHAGHARGLTAVKDEIDGVRKANLALDADAGPRSRKIAHQTIDRCPSIAELDARAF